MIGTKEAIRILELERDDWETSHCTPNVRKDAFNEGIKALEESIPKFHLQCLLCKGDVGTYSQQTMDQVSYTHYSYCEDCLRKGLKLLKEQDVSDTNVGKIPPASMNVLTADQLHTMKEQEYLRGYEDGKEVVFATIGAEPCKDTISRTAAIEAVIDLCKHYTPTKSVTHPHMDFVIEALKALPSAQPEPEIHWGYTPTYERPLADREIVPRLRDIQKQVGGSYAIDRAIEIIEAVAERRTDGTDQQTSGD